MPTTIRKENENNPLVKSWEKKQEIIIREICSTYKKKHKILRDIEERWV